MDLDMMHAQQSQGVLALRVHRRSNVVHADGRPARRVTRRWGGPGRIVALLVFTLACGLFLAVVEAGAAEFYIAVDGSDDNAGTIDQPFATFPHAIDLAGPGDTIFVRGGTYLLTQRITIEKAGREGEPIRLHAMPGEQPVLDFSGNPIRSHPAGNYALMRLDAVGVALVEGAEYWHIKDLTIQSTPFLGMTINGSHNVLEQLTLRWHQGTGLSVGGSHNLVLNCDSYENFDPQRNGEDADGFAAKFGGVGEGNVFRGTRAWANSDDGYDFWHAANPVLIEHCWAFDNGYQRAGWEERFEQRDESFRGDGLGFKLGQDASAFVLNYVVAFGNKAYGIDENGNGSVDGVTINHATLVNNAKDGNPIQISLNDGRPHTIRNTIAFDVDGSGVTQFDSAVTDIHNSWNVDTGITVTAADFVNLDMAQLLEDAKAPRKPDGSLPEIGLRLAPDSDLIDAGTNVNLPYQGGAPDLGAFEHQP